MKMFNLPNRFYFIFFMVGLWCVSGLSLNAQSLLGLSDMASFEKLLEGKTHFSIDVNGDYLAIGDYHAPLVEAGKTLPQVGVVAVYKKSEKEGWKLFQEIKSPSGNAYDNFGVSVAISDKFLVIGAIGYDDLDANGAVIEDAGAAFFYNRNGNGEFALNQKISSGDLKPYAIFGSKIEIKENEITINEQTEQNNNTNWVAHTFKQVDGSVWTPVKKAATDNNIKSPSLNQLFP